MIKPKFKDSYEVFFESDDRCQIRSSEKTTVLKGEAVRQVLRELVPLLDGHHTQEEIIERLGTSSRPAAVRAVIEKLYKAGFIEDAVVEYSGELSAQELEQYHQQLLFLDLSLEKGSPADAQIHLRNARLLIIGQGELATSLATQAARVGIGRIFAANLTDDSISRINPSTEFEAAGIPIHAQDSAEGAIRQDNPTLLTMSFDRPEPNVWDWVSELSQAKGLPLLNSQLNGTEAVVGPFVIPKQTACLNCYKLRVSSNLDFYEEHCAWEAWAMGDSARRAMPGTIAPFTDTVAGMATLEVIKHVTGIHQPETYNNFITINALTLEVIQHHLLRLPRCPVCGSGRGAPAVSPWHKI